MPNWHASMQQTYEYYLVDPGTWKDKTRINNVKSCTINRDTGVETLGSATFDIIGSISECYIRVYLVTLQNGLKERFPLGTYLVQTPRSNFDGKMQGVSVDAYTPLLELKENPPALGYYIPKGENIMDYAYRLVREQARAPVVEARCPTNLNYDFVANTEDNWLTYLKDLMANADYSFDLDEMGRILFMPKQEITSLQPVWTYDDDNSSILYPELSLDHNMYKIPNVVEVVYSNGTDHYYARAINDDVNSPTSVVNRGRKITRRVTDPDFVGVPTERQIDEYAEQLLETLSSPNYTITYTHGYCPARMGDCVRLNYSRAGLTNIKAKIISQTIKCEPGCKVTETAVFPTKLWG